MKASARVSVEVPAARAPRSVFVSGLAIITIALGGLLFISQTISTLSTAAVMRSPEYRMALRQAEQYAPGMGSRLFGSEGMLLSSTLSLGLDAGMVVAAIGLFLRRNWGRVAFMTLVWVQVAHTLFAAVSAVTLFRSVTAVWSLSPQAGSQSFGALGIIAVIGVIVLFVPVGVYITWKLMRPEIRAEFLPSGGPTPRVR